MTYAKLPPYALLCDALRESGLNMIDDITVFDGAVTDLPIPQFSVDRNKTFELNMG